MSQACKLGAVLTSAADYFQMDLPVETLIRICIRLEPFPRDFLLFGERGVGSRVGSSFPFVVIEYVSISTKAIFSVDCGMCAGLRRLSVGVISSSLVGPFVVF